MTPSDAIATVRALDLPRGRKAELARRILATADPAEVGRIVYRARAQELAAHEDHVREVAEECALRRDYEARQSQHEPETPSAPLSRWYADPDGAQFPEARPVVVTWTEPRKPDAERKQERREGIGKNHAQRVAEVGKPAHGTVSRYSRPHLCRCTECRAAKSAQNREYIAARRARRSAQ